MDDLACATCVYFSPPPSTLHSRDPKGQCRRHAPVLDKDDRGLRTIWPLVASHAWCGEHATLAEADA